MDFPHLASNLSNNSGILLIYLSAFTHFGNNPIKIYYQDSDLSIKEVAWRKLCFFIQFCWLLPLLLVSRQNKPCVSLPFLNVSDTFYDVGSFCAAPILYLHSTPAAPPDHSYMSHKHACSRSKSWFVCYKMTLPMSVVRVQPFDKFVSHTYSFICCSKLSMVFATSLRLFGSGRGCPSWKAFAISTAFSLTFSSHVSRSSKMASISHRS